MPKASRMEVIMDRVNTWFFCLWLYWCLLSWLLKIWDELKVCILQCGIKSLNNLIIDHGQESAFDGAVGQLWRESWVRAAIVEGEMHRPHRWEGAGQWSEQRCFCAQQALVKTLWEYRCSRAVGNTGQDQAQSLGVACCKALVYLGVLSLAFREQIFAWRLAVSLLTNISHNCLIELA